jgi:hypothetical protein
VHSTFDVEFRILWKVNPSQKVSLIIKTKKQLNVRYNFCFNFLMIEEFSLTVQIYYNVLLRFCNKIITWNTGRRSWIFSWDPQENIFIRYVSFVSLSSICKYVCISVCIYRFFTSLSLRFLAHSSKVTAHERIQCL